MMMFSDWLRTMSNDRFRRLPVDEEGKIKVIFTQGDLVSYTWPDLLYQTPQMTKATLANKHFNLTYPNNDNDLQHCYNYSYQINLMKKPIVSFLNLFLLIVFFNISLQSRDLIKDLEQTKNHSIFINILES